MKHSNLTSGFLLAVSLFAATPLCAQYNEILRVSTNGGLQLNSETTAVSASADGTVAALASSASNLISGDSNSASDIFLYIRGSGLSRISNTPGGVAANGASTAPVISQDGQVIAFVSSASNLVSSDTDGFDDIFVYDRGSSEITRVSARSNGTQANGASSAPAISSDGRFVAFVSNATNLDSAHSDTNTFADVFVHDRTHSTTVRISMAPGASQANGASSAPVVYGHGVDDFYLAFASAASNLVSSDTNNVTDIFFYDSADPVISRLSLRSNSTQGDGASTAPHMSSDGRYVVFQSAATDLVTNDSNAASDVFWVDRNTASSLERVSLSTIGTDANGASISPKVSNNGNYVVFASSASNLVANDSNSVSDIFVHNRSASDTSRVNVSTSGRRTSEASSAPAMQGTGKFVAFLSEADDLVSGDTNSAVDGFLINTECLVDLGSYNGDTDGDSTLNCDEDCGADPLKTSPGVCGCGIPDTDTDGDGSEDCNESCDSDNQKTEPGDCGCGVADTDTNGNGKGDCLDPTSSTIPDTDGLFLRVIRRGTERRLEVNFPGEFTGVRYTYVLYLNGRRLYMRSTGKLKFTVKNAARGRYSIKYRVSLGGITSLWSKKVSKRVN